jgi:hypothetical protein
MGISFGKCFGLIYEKKVDEIKIQGTIPKTIFFDTKRLKFILFLIKF